MPVPAPAVTSPTRPRSGPQVALARTTPGPPPEVAAPARTAATSPRDTRLGWAGPDIPRDARSPPCAGIQANCGDGTVRPHGGWRHVPARGSVSNTGGRRDAHTQRQTPSGKESGGIPLGSTRLPSPGRREMARAGRHARSALPGSGGRRCHDIERQLRDTLKASRLPPGWGQSPAEPHSSRSPQLTQPGPPPRAGREAAAGIPIPECGSFGRHLVARAVSAARCAAPRTVMHRTAVGAGCGVTPNLGYLDTPFWGAF